MKEWRMPREKKYNRRHSSNVYPASDGELARWDRMTLDQVDVARVPALAEKKNKFEVNEIGH